MNLTFSQITKVKGKIIDEKLNCIPGVKITNINTKKFTFSNQIGEFEIEASKNDTLKFEIVGLTNEKIVVKKINETIRLIMINKEVNCLGIEWTQKQYDKAYRKINKRLIKLYKIANKKKVWNSNHCINKKEYPNNVSKN